jgi:hypothetical protein
VDNLVGILKNEFRVSLSVENFEYITQHLPPDSEPMRECAIPMVCFCDIPLSQVERHMKTYGDYGLGLTKDWGMSKRISPVLYTHPNSPAPFSSADHINLLESLGLAHASDDQKALALNAGLFVYLQKPYEGFLERKGPKERVRFYDEREWRYLPPELESIAAISREDFADPIKSKPVRDQVSRIPPLSFEPEDINYIVVATDAEMLTMVRAVRSIKGKYDADTVDLLTSKIISAERIKEDF